MGKRRKSTKQRKGRRKPRQPARLEWVGGVVDLLEGERLAVWVQRAPRKVLRATEVVKDAGDALRRCFRDLLADGDAKPTRLRVAASDVAESLRADVPEVGVEVGATPEVDVVAKEMQQRVREGLPATYVCDVSEQAVKAVFEVAGALWRAAPWMVPGTDLETAVDAEASGVRRAEIVVTGQEGGSPGFVIAPSEASEATWFEREEAGVDEALLEIGFAEGDGVGALLAQEARQQGWPIAGKRAVPVVLGRGPRRTRALSEEELDVLINGATAYLRFLETYGDELDQGFAWRARYQFSVGPDVALVHPSEAYESMVEREGDAGAGGEGEPQEEPVEAVVARIVRAHLRGPCDCGSDAPRRACCWTGEMGAWDQRLMEGAGALDPLVWSKPMAALREGMAHTIALFVPLVLHTASPGGDTVARQVGRIDGELRPFVAAHEAAWLGLWEVVHATPAEARLVGLLSGARRTVAFPTASAQLRVGEVLLARVVTVDGESFLSAAHERRLPIEACRPALAHLRKHHRTRYGVAPEKLRRPESVQAALEAWHAAEVAHDDDGKTAEPIAHRFRFEPRAREWLLERLAALPETTIQDDGAVATVVMSHGQTAAEVTVTHGELVLAADAVPHHRGRLLEAVGDIAFADR